MFQLRLRRLALVAAGLALASSGSVSPSSPTRQKNCALIIVPKVEAGHAYYEIIGNGFSTGQVQIDAVNRATQQNVSFTVTPDSMRFSGVFIGKTPEGAFYSVQAGRWKVSAKGAACVAKTKLKVPKSIASGVPVGAWGGSNIGMRVTDTVTAIDFFCAYGAANQPMALDDAGRFDVVGIYGGVKLGWPPLEVHQARYIGSVQGKTMALTVTLLEANTTPITYSLTLDKEPPRLPLCR